ncbi:MAG: adenosylcobinamide-GDP ribazoletransferase [Ornithinimicrobium sp.]
MMTGRIGPARSAATALTFLTRFPVARWSGSEPDHLSRSTPWFPVVGLMVGSLVSAALLLVGVVGPVWAASLAAIVTGLAVTGALHEDGLADVADSAGAFTVKQKLAVMRDSRVGTYGVLALLIVLMVRFASLSAFAGAGWPVVAGVVVTAHVLARWSSVALMAWQPYARPDSPNGRVAAGVGTFQASWASVVAAAWVLIALTLVGPWWVVVVPVALAAVGLSGWWFRRSFGGITGDCLGATNIGVELSVLLLGALMWS